MCWRTWQTRSCCWLYGRTGVQQSIELKSDYAQAPIVALAGGSGGFIISRISTPVGENSTGEPQMSTLDWQLALLVVKPIARTRCLKYYSLGCTCTGCNMDDEVTGWKTRKEARLIDLFANRSGGCAAVIIAYVKRALCRLAIEPHGSYRHGEH